MKTAQRHCAAACHRPRRGLYGVLALVLGALSLSAAAAEEQRVDDPFAESIYRIGVPDLLSIRVWQQEELSGEALVRSDGRISVPLVGDIVAEGLTPEELAGTIAGRLGDYVTEPRVDVAVIEMRSRVVSVIGGGVEQSGVIELRHDMRVLDAIAEMGGFTPFARKNRIRVLRTGAAGERELLFDYNAFVNGKARNSNFRLEPGDTVVVPE